MRLRVRVHRWVGLVLTVPFFVWTATGLLFHVKPGWSEAYETLSENTKSPIPLDKVAPPPSDTSRPVTRVELFASALGPVYRISRAEGQELLDARTGARLSPLEPEQAVTIAKEATSRSRFRNRYGEVVGVDTTERSVVVRFVGGPRVTVDRRSASLSRTGADTERIDWLYRMHYLQWTGIAWLDRIVVVVAILATWLLSVLGVLMFVRRPRARS